MEKLNLDKYNNFKEYQDIVKYMLTNNTSKDQIAAYLKIMQFDNVEKTIEALQFFVDIDEQITVNIFSGFNGSVYILDYTEKDTPSGQIPEMDVALKAEFIEFNDNDIYPLDKKDLYNVIYNELKNKNFKEIEVDTNTENNILEAIHSHMNKTSQGFYKINDLIMSYGTLYDTPVQLVIKNIFVKNDQLYFNGILFYNNVDRFIMRAI